MESFLQGSLVESAFLFGILTYVLNTFWSRIRPILDYLVYKHTTTININDSDKVFQYISIALMDHIRKDRGFFNISAVSSYSSYTFDDAQQHINLSPGYGFRYLKIDGRHLFIWSARRDLNNRDQGKAYEESLKIWCPFSSPSLVVDLVEQGKKVYDKLCNDKKFIDLYTASYNEWNCNQTVKKTALDSLVFNNETKEDAINDLEEFLSKEKWYADRCVDYKRGYLLAGSPGNGKTSLIAAIANKYKKDVYIPPLSDPTTTDSSLLNLMSKIPENSIIVLEDIDRIAVSNKQVEESSTQSIEQTKLTLSGLLNALDGMQNSHGMLIFMTANHPERLDPALVRPGRVDKKVFIRNPNRAAIETYIKKFYEINKNISNKQISDLSDLFAIQGQSMSYVKNQLLENKSCVSELHDKLFKNQNDKT